MTAAAVLHGVAGLVASFFAYDVWRGYARHRAPSAFWWGAALALFAFSALADAVASIAGWSPWLYRLWYVAAAWLVAAFGIGSAYLVLGRRAGHAVLAVLGLVGLAMLWSALRAPVDAAALAAGMGGAIGGEGWADPAVRRFSPLLTIPGSLMLLGGAAVAWARTRHAYGLWIAGGTVVLAGGGALTRLGLPQVLPLANLLGIWLLYRGHRLAREAKGRQQGGERTAI
ncbi:MAG TPA: hypothetical protein VIK99_00250 [Thermaerobacter sp.]